ncbi:hypothetical protein RBSWK_05992 [Rhodopirellula baltica SWK14]|uniref:Uncharacterized protein n=1 Tax=Rhodopirellula baltica SWK14 TaxID=993516 RepID=L7CAF2_RHOBT|nr:hypothetical protein RBSWK_05992 [Rhodopirellula baltica SWK14]
MNGATETKEAGGTPKNLPAFTSFLNPRKAKSRQRGVQIREISSRCNPDSHAPQMPAERLLAGEKFAFAWSNLHGDSIRLAYFHTPASNSAHLDTD